jgi:hypothetical protein
MSNNVNEVNEGNDGSDPPRTCRYAPYCASEIWRACVCVCVCVCLVGWGDRYTTPDTVPRRVTGNVHIPYGGVGCVSI